MKNSKFHTIKNSSLQVKITHSGVEICSIKKLADDKEYMWDANPDVWGSYAPVLFPIIGSLKNGQYLFKGETYAVPKHGFIRNNEHLKVTSHLSDSITFQYKHDQETLKNYPFEFEFRITYSLQGYNLKVSHEVINYGDNIMFFSLGGHPAFKCPLNEDESYSDYYLQFDKKEASKTHLLNSNGLLSGKSKSLLENTDTLQLSHSLFDHDALIFKDLKSRKVSLNHKIKGKILTVRYEDFKYLGIWAKPNGDFICIEPWLGVTDHENTSGNFETKEGILKLDPGKKISATYVIEIE